MIPPRLANRVGWGWMGGSQQYSFFCCYCFGFVFFAVLQFFVGFFVYASFLFLLIVLIDFGKILFIYS